MEFNFEPSNEKDILKKYSRNLNEEVSANKLNKIIGREQEIRRVIEILSRKEKNNPVLIGEPGVGKTAIVEGFVQKIISKEVPENLVHCVVYEVNLSSLIAGTFLQGEFEKRLNALIKEAKQNNGAVILFIDEIHQLMGMGKAGNNSGMDAANILKPIMARGGIKIIGATTSNEYRQYIEKDGALERRFQKILVEEPTPEEALTIMRGLKEKWEIYHKVRIQDNALVASVKLSERYISDKYLPDKAIDLIDEAAAKIKTEAHTSPSEPINKKIFYLETEKIALSKEEGTNQKERINEIEIELEKLKQERDLVEKEWKEQKEQQVALNKIKKEIEKNNWDVERYQNQGEYTEASKILYSVLPELKKKLEAIEKSISENKKVLIKDYISEIDVAEIISRITKIPLNKIFEKEQDKLLNLFNNLKKRVKGQDEALKLVSDTVLKNRVGINNPNRPIGSFLFVGPTGVGKTEVAKSLAENLFNTEKAIVRINMSEYMEKHSISRLIGAPPGYIGYEQAGELSEQIRRKPYSVVLLDEIEKAHPDILNVLLQVLDEGTLKDNQGRNINFKNTIIIMTSNVGALYLMENKEDMFERELKTSFKPEFLNRIDEIIKFNSITMEFAKEIAQKMLDDLEKRLKDNNYQITFDKSVVEYVAKNGYSKEYGARPINRVIQKTIENFITESILKNELIKDRSTIINFANNKLAILKSN
ncbi:AAA family ATPase [Malacoplasma penetrans]|uniref:ATP-dependent Clp protease ATP-binding subunit n=1 Tax=Malacoplasma penetrans TaxID=28227 RepID=UPI001011BDDD|nr:AAA family ATPase [Malacoplasma penetrans]RXY96368.1 AAA family ATPase [Malacoplasma penetrans]